MTKDNEISQEVKCYLPPTPGFNSLTSKVGKIQQ